MSATSRAWFGKWSFSCQTGGYSSTSRQIDGEDGGEVRRKPGVTGMLRGIRHVVRSHPGKLSHPQSRAVFSSAVSWGQSLRSPSDCSVGICTSIVSAAFMESRHGNPGDSPQLNLASPCICDLRFAIDMSCLIDNMQVVGSKCESLKEFWFRAMEWCRQLRFRCTASGVHMKKMSRASLAAATSVDSRTKSRRSAPAVRSKNVRPATIGAEAKVPPTARWTFLTNHSHVLILISRNPDVVLRQVAIEVGITERAVQRIIADLEEGGFIEREKIGRKNRYRILTEQPLRHSVESHRTIGNLLTLMEVHMG